MQPTAQAVGKPARRPTKPRRGGRNTAGVKYSQRPCPPSAPSSTKKSAKPTHRLRRTRQQPRPLLLLRPRCPIPEGQPGVCKVRFNRGGKLYVPWGYTAGMQCDPIEKKPFFHAHPGALAYSFGMLGCDLHCGYCQNWVTSQALRDPNAVSPPLEASPEALVRDALDSRRESSRQHLQRAAHHQRMGSRCFQRSQSRRAHHRIRLQRQRHAASPRIHPPVARSLQSRSQEFRRPPLPRTRRPHRPDPRQHPPHS